VKIQAIAYWVTTAIIAFVMLSGGVADLVHQKDTLEGMLHLGYPLYFMRILGFWKVLGGIAILVPGFPRVKEWAYAGIFFDFTGAVASHIATGDGFGQFVWPALFAILAIASWALRPPSRRLGFLLVAKT
jgi:uncharacterized membrane protein YphA (DoxX/SURF4 family)